MAKKLPPIPVREWIALATGIILFVLAECVLFFVGYTDILVNSLISLAFASALSYGTFGVKNKIERIVASLRSLADKLLLIPEWLGKAIMATLIALPKIINLLGILLLNLAMIPILAVYLTIYGLIFSLSGSTAKIMMSHYDSFGNRMIAPIKKYLHFDFITGVIVMGILLAIAIEVLGALQSAITITATDAANNITFGTTASIESYLPVVAIIAIIIILYLLYRGFGVGSQAFGVGYDAR